MQDIERNIRSMQNDMTKLNTLITKESGLRQALQQGTVLMESDFIQALKVSLLFTIRLLFIVFIKPEEECHPVSKHGEVGRSRVFFF